MSQIYRKSGWEEDSDTQLLDRALNQADERAGKEAASELLKRYRERVYRWCLSRVREPELALDLSQDVLLSAYRNLPKFDGRARFSSWLFAIARNRCLNELRRPALFSQGEDLDLLPDRAKSQDQNLEELEDEERVLALIREHLPELDRKVLWLRCFEKVPVDRISEMMSIREASGARGVLQRARRKLRAVLDQETAGEGVDADE